MERIIPATRPAPTNDPVADHPAIDPFVRLPEVRRLLAMGTSKIYAEMKDGRLPRPIKLSTRFVAWRQSWIVQYQKDREAEHEAAQQTRRKDLSANTKHNPHRSRAPQQSVIGKMARVVAVAQIKKGDRL